MDHDQNQKAPMKSMNPSWAIDHIVASLTGRPGVSFHPGRRSDDDPSPTLSRYHLELLVCHSPLVTDIARGFLHRALGALLGADPPTYEELDAMAQLVLDVEANDLRSGRRQVTKHDFLQACESRNRDKNLAALLYRSIIDSIWSEARRASAVLKAGPEPEAAGQGPIDP